MHAQCIQVCLVYHYVYVLYMCVGRCVVVASCSMHGVIQSLHLTIPPRVLHFVFMADYVNFLCIVTSMNMQELCMVLFMRKYVDISYPD